MKKVRGISVAAVGLLLPLLSVAQNQVSNGGQRHERSYGSSIGRWEGRLSAEDQGRFDDYYSRWLDYRRTKDRDNQNSMENRMRDVMSHYNIPSDVPFGQIASIGSQGYSVYRRGDGNDDNDGQSQRDHPYAQSRPQGQWQGRLSPEDQGRFDSYYTRWVDYRRTNDREEVASMENRMRELIVRYSIPPNIQFSHIASPSVGGYAQPNIPRFAGDDEQHFRSYYSRWQEYRRTNNREEIGSMESRMQEVMAQHNIPNNVSYEDVMNMLNGYNQNQ